MKLKQIESLFLILSCLFLAVCNAGGSVLKDGYYAAESTEFDEDGWKDYVSVCVSGGKIILVEFDAYNMTGLLKSWDMDFMRLMSESKGTYPNVYNRHYESKFLELQGTEGIDAVSGATISYHNFIKLSEAVLKNAKEGNVKTTFVSFNGDLTN